MVSSTRKPTRRRRGLIMELSMKISSSGTNRSFSAMSKLKLMKKRPKWLKRTSGPKSKTRFTFLAELVGGAKTYKDCYKRAKLLKLKNGTVSESKEISNSLLNKQGEHQSIKDRLVRHALSTLMKHLKEKSDGQIELAQIKAMCSYLCQI